MGGTERYDKRNRKRKRRGIRARGRKDRWLKEEGEREGIRRISKKGKLV